MDKEILAAQTLVFIGAILCAINQYFKVREAAPLVLYLRAKGIITMASA